MRFFRSIAFRLPKRLRQGGSRTLYPWLGLAAAILGLIVSGLTWSIVSHRESELAKLELSSEGSGYARTLQFGIDAYLRRVVALRALFESSNHVSRGQFDKFTKQLLSGQNAILGMSWIPRVSAEQRAAFERDAALDGVPGYQIKSVAADGTLGPAPEKSEYYPILFAATEDTSSPVYGLDLNDGGVRQQTLERARDTDAIATSPLFTLQSGTGHRRGFFVALPVYAVDLPHQTLEQRIRDLRGYVEAVFQTSVLMETILSTTRKPSGFDLYFYPADGAQKNELLYFHGSRLRDTPTEPVSRAELSAAAHWAGVIEIGDARWTIIAAPIPEATGMRGHPLAWMVLVVGLLVTSAVVWFILSSGRHARRLEGANARLDKTLGALNTANDELSAALNNMILGFVMFDSQGRVAVHNQRYVEMYGLSHDVVKPGCSLLQLLEHRAAIGNLKDDPKRYAAALMAELSKGKVVNWIVESGQGREISITNKPMPGGGWVATHEDVTERRRAEAKISHMAMHDSLTGLPNRNLFNQEVARCFEQLGRGQKFALLCLDLDHFKNVNDTLGHPCGDKLLQEVAARLRRCMRQGDLVARLGGDEFAILQHDVIGLDETRSLSERVIAAIDVPFEIDGQQVAIGVSVGIARAPIDANNAVELLKVADIALFRAKADGRNTCRFFDFAMHGQIQARQELELDLRRAVLQNEFVVHYQPLVNLESGQITGFEALIRWNHPERGTIAPADFIPFAEETGLIVPIGEWVLSEACEEAARWPDDISVAVNLSPVQLREVDLCQTVSTALARSGLAASRLELEITETMLLRNQVVTHETMRQLRMLGVRIAMDDFGTGHSSLSTLRTFPIDRIKIDRSFIHDLLAKNDSRAIVQAVVQLASSLGMKTTAEGVETQGESDYLRRAGCTEAQGFLFGEAGPPRYAEALLRSVAQKERSSMA
jgi:diguanylate cyclase (GGDEF)-like protein/PAS domain S-box-containing protein